MIVVTGGLGFIGSHTARYLVDAGQDVLVTSHVRREVPPHLAPFLNKGLQVEAVDTTKTQEFRAFLGRYDVDGVIHLATPPRSGLTPAEELMSAVQGLISVVDCAASAGVGRVCVGSSLAVYGSKAVSPMHEDQSLPVVGEHPIQAAKLAEEILGSYLGSATGCEVVFLRIGVVYGPTYRTLINVASQLCHQVAGRMPLQTCGAEFVLAHPDDALDLCYVKDCARAIGLLQMSESLSHLTYNVGTGGLTRVSDICEALSRLVARPVLTTTPDRGPLDPGRAMDVRRIAQEVGFLPEWPLDRAVKDYVSWLVEHEI